MTVYKMNDDRYVLVLGLNRKFEIKKNQDLVFDVIFLQFNAVYRGWVLNQQINTMTDSEIIKYKLIGDVDLGNVLYSAINSLELETERKLEMKRHFTEQTEGGNL